MLGRERRVATEELVNRPVPQGTMRRLFSSSEGLEPNRYVIARYRISAANDQALRESATRLALLTALGTVDPLPIETLDAL